MPSCICCGYVLPGRVPATKQWQELCPPCELHFRAIGEDWLDKEVAA